MDTNVYVFLSNTDTVCLFPENIYTEIYGYLYLSASVGIRFYTKGIRLYLF